MIPALHERSFGTPMLWQQIGREFAQSWRLSMDLRITGCIEIPEQIRFHVPSGPVIADALQTRIVIPSGIVLRSKITFDELTALIIYRHTHARKHVLDVTAQFRTPRSARTCTRPAFLLLTAQTFLPVSW